MYRKNLYTDSNEAKLYNKILHLSRSKFLYTELLINDTFQNKINLIFLHIAFIFTKVKQNNTKNYYNKFYQKMFDYTFKCIEINMREIGHGDTLINKNMKFLIKTFYAILLNCEKYIKKNNNDKFSFLSNFLEVNNVNKNAKNLNIIEYFNQYHSFCLALSADNVLNGDLNFNYRKI